MRVEKKLEKRIKEIDNLEGLTEWNLNLNEDRFKAKSDWYELIIREERATIVTSLNPAGVRVDNRGVDNRAVA